MPVGVVVVVADDELEFGVGVGAANVILYTPAVDMGNPLPEFAMYTFPLESTTSPCGLNVSVARVLTVPLEVIDVTVRAMVNLLSPVTKTVPFCVTAISRVSGKPDAHAAVTLLSESLMRETPPSVPEPDPSYAT